MKNSQLIFFLLILLSVQKIQAQVTPTVQMDSSPAALRSMPENTAGTNSANIIQAGESLGDECVGKTIKNTEGEDLRFPPGTTGGYWDFQRGGFMEQRFLPENWTLPAAYDGPPLANTFQDYKNATDTAMSRLLLNLNLLTSDRHFQRAAVFAAKNYNIKVSALELGNEYYFGLEKEPQFTYRFPTAKAYADSCNAWAALLKATFPNIQIAALGAVPEPSDPARFQNWLTDVIANGSSNIDAYTLHKYSGSGLPNGVGDVSSASNEDLKSMFKQAFKGPLVTIAPLFTQLQTAGKKAWITEFNLFDRARIVHGSWAHGLFVGAQMLAYLRNPVVTKVDCHTLLGTGIFAAIFADSLGFVYNDGFMSPNLSFYSNACELTASGNALSLVMGAIRNSTTAQLIKFSGSMPPVLDVGYPSIVGVRYIKPTGKDAVVMNLSDVEVNFSTNPVFTGAGGSYQMIWGTPQKFIEGNAVAAAPTDSTLQIITGSFTGLSGETITLKPYSIIRFNSVNAVQITASVDTVCNGTFGTLKAYGKGPFMWTSDEPGFTSVTSDVIHVDFNAIANVTYNYTATGSIGSATKSILFVKPPTLEIKNGTVSITEVTICAGASITLNAAISGSSPNKKYAWTRSEDINNPSLQTVVITPKKAINKYILYATDGLCWNLTDTVVIKVKGLADAGNDTTVCNAAANLSSQVIDATNTYEWRAQPYTAVLSNNANYTVASPPIGSTSYRLKVTSGACTSEDYKIINNYNCCAATGVLAMAPYSNIADLVANGNSPPLTAYLNATKDTLTGYPNDIYFNGPFYVNKDFTFINCPKLKFGENATLNVGNYKKLNIVNSTLGACSNKLWEGIKTLTSMTGLNLVNSTVKEAKIGVETRQNAVIGIRNSTLKDNNYHLKFFDYTISYPDSIYGNSFLATQLLLSGGAGNIVRAAIVIEKSTDVGIGNALKAVNTINGVNLYGIDCINAGATVVNNNISNISYQTLPPALIGAQLQSAANAGNAGVHAVNSSTTNRTINIGGNATNQANTFNNCKYNAVYIEGKAKTNIVKNTFTNFNKGVKLYNPTWDQNIDLNNFNSNYYVNTSASATNRECTAVDASSTTQVSVRFYITNNTITNCRMGGFVSNINGLRTGGNKIVLSKLATGTQSAHYGFNLLTCSNARIETDSIATDPTAFAALTTAQRQGYQGVYLNTVSNSLVRDNDLTRFGNHISILNNCNGTAVTCNRFYRGGTTGIYNSSAELFQTIKLTSATVSDLGTLNSSANNEWSIEYATTNTAQNYRVAGNTNGAQPKYYKFSSDPNTKFPEPFVVTGSGLGTASSTGVNTCNPGIPIIIANQNNDAEHTNADVTKDNEMPDSLLVVETVLNYETIFDSTNTAIGYFADLAIYNLGQILIDSGYVDNASVEATFEGTDIETIMELNNALMVSDSAKAAELCSELQGTDLVMQNIKTMNAILIKSEDYHFTSQDSSVINGIAYQRVQAGGPAVVTARNWLGIYLNDTDLPDNKRLNHNEETDQDWQVNIYPNPSKGILRLESSIKENLNLLIFDVLGNKVAERKVFFSSSTLEFKNLSNGIYTIQISNQKGVQKNIRWVLEK